VSYEYFAPVSYDRILAGLVDVKGMMPPEGREWSDTSLLGGTLLLRAA
jgi:hypothetical protein